MSTAVPMSSAKIEAGRYIVLGTTHEVMVKSEPGEGWWLHVASATTYGREIGPFRTKREALQYCQEHPEL
jgi:hypothetical protein